MSKFIARLKEGGLDFGSTFNAARFRQFAKDHVGLAVHIEPMTPESKKQRGFYHGAVCAMFAYFHEGLDHRSWRDIEKVHEWLKLEHNGEFMVMNGKSHLIPKSTAGQLNRGYLERCIADLEENYGIDPAQVLNPKEYKYWKDVVFPNSGPTNFIDYQIEKGLIHK